MMRLVSLYIEEKSSYSLALPPPPAMGGHNKKAAICEPGRSPSPGTESAGTLLLDFLVSRNVKNKLLFKPLSLWYFVMAT